MKHRKIKKKNKTTKRHNIEHATDSVYCVVLIRQAYGKWNEGTSFIFFFFLSLRRNNMLLWHICIKCHCFVIFGRSFYILRMLLRCKVFDVHMRRKKKRILFTIIFVINICTKIHSESTNHLPHFHRLCTEMKCLFLQLVFVFFFLIRFDLGSANTELIHKYMIQVYDCVMKLLYVFHVLFNINANDSQKTICNCTLHINIISALKLSMKI